MTGNSKKTESSVISNARVELVNGNHDKGEAGGSGQAAANCSYGRRGSPKHAAGQALTLNNNNVYSNNNNPSIRTVGNQDRMSSEKEDRLDSGSLLLLSAVPGDCCHPAPAASSAERDVDDDDDGYTPYMHLSQLSIDGGYDGSDGCLSSSSRGEVDQYYTRPFEEPGGSVSHSQQPSYAQSEGYHSYVSSTDSSTTAPYTDRSRRGGETGGRESSASSGSSSETLKWHGSLSDVSSFASIAHSARVPPPQRHHSESVLYLDPHASNRRLFPVSTYEPPPSPRTPGKLSVAERVCALERQQQCGGLKQSDCSLVERRVKPVTDHASLKAIQKKALLSFYERHHSAWKSEPQLAPPPPPRPPPLQTSSRRASSASDYISPKEATRPCYDSNYHSKMSNKEVRHQYSSSCGSLSSNGSHMGPMIMGPSISVDDWVPARPPKKPHLRGAAYTQRPVSPEPPPPPSPAPETGFFSDEPLPPPPPELMEPSTTHATTNGFQSKFNERFVDNMIESRLNYCDTNKEIWERKIFAEKRLSERKVPNLLSPPLPTKGRRLNTLPEQPRSLDSNMSFIESDYELNKPGPQTPTYKKNTNHYSGERKLNYMEIRKNIIKSQNEPMVTRASVERHSMRFTKPLTNGKIISSKSHCKILSPTNSEKCFGLPSINNGSHYTSKNDLNHSSGKVIHGGNKTKTNKLGLLISPEREYSNENGKVSPPSAQKATLVRAPSDVVRKISFATGIQCMDPIGKTTSESQPLLCEPLNKLSIFDPPVFPQPSLTESLVLKQSSMVESLVVKRPHVSEPLVAKHQAERRQLSTSETPKAALEKNSSPEHSPTQSSSVTTSNHHHKSQSKASYLASYKRDNREKEKGLPNFQGSYKRTMSPSAGRIIHNSGSEPTVDKEAELLKELDIGQEKKQTTEERHDVEEEEEGIREKELKTLARNVSSVSASSALPAAPRRAPRPPRAASDPTASKSPHHSTEEERRVTEGDGVKVTDAASQTTPAPSPPPAQPRRPLQEEIDCDLLSRDLASQLSPSHKLHTLLAPGPEVKRSTDYVSGLFRLNLAPRINSTPSDTSISSQSEEKEVDEKETSTEDSALMAKLISDSKSDTSNSLDTLQQKKEELVCRLSRKLCVLRSEAVAVGEETRVNDALGDVVAERVDQLARPHESAKFRLHVKEVGHITTLLLALSSRLARAENSLLTLPPQHSDRKIMEEKRDKLVSQLGEAKKLKENIDKRSESVSSMLYNYLTGEEYTDYDHFISMKSKLLVDSREITEKIQLGEEQLAALKETLDQVR